MITDQKILVVVDSVATNCEIFDTLEKANEYADTIKRPRVWLAWVRNSYVEDDGGLNYEDLSDTFTFLHRINRDGQMTTI